jgi:hydrogenase maturation protein HypF
MHPRVKILVRGIVQGVGFRPYVYGLARSLNLKGFVMNSSRGVTIEIEGDNSSTFIDRLTKEAPPLSQIMGVDIFFMPYHGYQDFQIIESEDEGSFTLISPDVSICNDCFRELLDENDRRYLYPFINCTNCGPRYTITKFIPYDRPNTTMSVFKMCPECDEEYHNPEDRRFHAQPNACPTCGPHVELKIKSEKLKMYENEDPMRATIKILKEGYIVAIKGLGGFHIACDAINEAAVEKLRVRKRKSNKPFALMAPDIETIRKFCKVSEDEESLLISKERPIVLLKKKQNSLPEAISPNNPCLGFMLPYTPLHYLLFHYPITHHSSLVTNFEALIMTSGNLSEEPIVIDNDEALSTLSGIADAFLIHNRDIFMRVDDSVVRVMNGKSLSYIRRSRGKVPDPVLLHEDGPEVLGCGADIKNTFTLTKGSFAIPSQHIGDMENYETLQFFEESLENLKAVYRVNPVALAHDLHPGYLSTQWALRQEGIEKFGIQHHYAHIASVMAEKGIKEKVLGFSFDGTGYGTDGNLWGGEVLIADIGGFKRAGHFMYISLPGGETAVKEPWKTAVSYIWNMAQDKTMNYLESIGFLDKYGQEMIGNILRIVDKKQFSPLSSGAGRLFDAVSAILGISDKNTFEGEAAIALESITKTDIIDDYPVDIKFRDPIEVDFSQTILKIIEDFIKGEDKGVIASLFHNTIATAIVRIAQKLSSLYTIDDVILSGGVFQNAYLLERTIDRLKSIGLDVHVHEKVPCNDAGISLGQAYILRERIKAEK